MQTSNAEAYSRNGARNWVAALREFANAPLVAVERCEFCGEAISPVHSHLIEQESRRLVCACLPCALGWSEAKEGVGSAYHRIPSEVRLLGDFRMSDMQWDALMIPIGLAFFLPTTAVGRADRVIAMYPGPAGTVESLLELESWQSLVSANPGLATLRPDVEALLVYRVGAARRYFRTPIDRCYALTGLMRKQWHGLSGGSVVWESIDRFFAELESCAAQSLPAQCHA